MIDDSLLETDFLTELRHGPELRFRRMSKKDRRVVVTGHPEDLFDFRHQPALVVEKVMAILERIGPGQRLCMRIRVSALVPGTRLAPDDGERIGRGVVGHPEAND